MSTKKPTPAKKKANLIKSNWKQTGDAYISGLGTVKHFDVTMDREIGGLVPPAGETRVSELEAENSMLKHLLKKYEAPKDPQPLNKPAPMPTMLTQFCEQMDGQLSRLYNSINTLEATAERLQFTKSDGQAIQGTNPASSDLSTRLGGLLDYFSFQNTRLEDLNAKLNNLI